MTIRPVPGFLTALAACAAAACSSGPDESSAAPSEETPSALASQCAADNGGITLPDGFCAILFVDSLPGTRHVEIAANGDVFVARRNRRTSRDAPIQTGGVTVLRDTDGDGVADRSQTWGENGGNDVLIAEGFVYHAPDDAVLRYPLDEGAMVPSGPPDTIVSGLPDTRNHTAKSIALGSDGSLYVNIGAPSNACMVESRTAGSPGQDPCRQLEDRAGIWRFDADRTGQTQADGTRFATGLRNVVALQVHPGTNVLYGVMHGRDQLHGMFPDLFTVDQNAEKPSEEFVRIVEGSDFGWPYCYHDPETGAKVLAPEYGGDGAQVGRCADKDMPIIGFPAHWAPNDLEFYSGTQFPAAYRGGAFIAFHGSWNRAPRPQDGYRVVFVPASANGPDTTWETFADGFRREGDNASVARPVGLSTGPDGSLFISDSSRGRIWRVVYRGS
ncbi:MAG: PQQ-dependent sugar dehydrogenase [Gemmatimonadota bacterium]|jgi:glucose/arabinose dehydrogenase